MYSYFLLNILNLILEKDNSKKMNMKTKRLFIVVLCLTTFTNSAYGQCSEAENPTMKRLTQAHCMCLRLRQLTQS